MSLRVQGMSNLLAHDALFDALLVPFGNDQALHENAGRVDMVGIDRAGGKQLLDLRDRDAAGRRHPRVAVARRLAIDEIALLVPAPCLDDGKDRKSTRLNS